MTNNSITWMTNNSVTCLTRGGECVTNNSKACVFFNHTPFYNLLVSTRKFPALQRLPTQDRVVRKRDPSSLAVNLATSGSQHLVDDKQEYNLPHVGR